MILCSSGIKDSLTKALTTVLGKKRRKKGERKGGREKVRKEKIKLELTTL